MGLTVFFALCILGLDFMIYVLFKLTYGNKRSVVARRVAAQREAARAESSGLYLVPARKNVPAQQEPENSAGSPAPDNGSRKPFPRNSSTKRIA
jgi:hypothetical protein